MAFFSPVWASEMTSFTPSRPRVFNDRRKPVQKPSFSLDTTSNPSSFRQRQRPLGRRSGARPWLCSRSRRGTRREVLARKRAVTKLGHLRIQSRTDAGYFGLKNAGVRPECCDHTINFAGGDAVDIGLHHDGEHCLVDAAAALQQGGEEGALP